MKITAVTTTLFGETASRLGRHAPLSDSGSGNTHCLVELSTDNGLTGIAGARGWARQSILALAREVLIGEDPSAVTALWQQMGERLSGRSDGGFHHARAVLDLALWDLKARANDEPLWKTLGGARPRANAYASWTGATPSDENIVEWFGRMSADHGFRGGKVPVGTDDLEGDIQRLGLMRRALMKAAPAPELMIDAGGRWRPTEARRNIRQIESEHDLSFVQHAVAHGDFLASKRLSDSIRAAVCAGGGLTTSQAFLPYFHHHAANVVEIDMNYFGITGALQLADAAYGFELPVTLSAAAGNLPAHLAAVMPNFMSMEVIDPGPGDGIIANNVTFESGWGIAGDAAGNGLSIRRELLAQAAVETGD
jgi:L-alanine-DL-glutamate epimerase-like enolase superfamily enzyme